MARQLVADGSLVGRSRDELIAQLGPPDEQAVSPGEIWWLVGYRDSGIPMMFPYTCRLVVDPGPDGRAVRAAAIESD